MREWLHAPPGRLAGRASARPSAGVLVGRRRALRVAACKALTAVPGLACVRAPLQALRRAPRLELLHYNVPGMLIPSNMSIIASLPALCRLSVIGPWTPAFEQDATNLARARLPETVTVEPINWEAFMEASAAFLLG